MVRHTRTPFPFERSHATKTGVFLPISGRAATPETLRQAARSAEDWGFDSIWAADRIIIPWRIDTPYPYGKDGAFIVPPDRPFLDSLTCLTFLAACTSRVELGISVLVLPYRQPLVWAKIAVTLDHLSEGRFILGVGVGWMEEEFRALQAPFEDRGAQDRRATRGPAGALVRRARELLRRVLRVRGRRLPAQAAGAARHPRLDRRRGAAGPKARGTLW